MTTETIAMALGGRKAGAAWMARCPAHDDREPSLAITDARDGKVLVCCHAGCSQQDVIAAFQARGLWDAGERRTKRFSRKSDRREPPEPDGDVMKRTEAALAIWGGSQPAEGTPVENYLQSRGITIPFPATICFHPDLKHPSGGIWPAMVAQVIKGDKFVAVHRTFLARDGRAKAPIEPQKMMLGPCRGGAIRLAPPDDGQLMVGEGIETCLSAMQATSRPAWAALSTSGLRTLELPTRVRDVIILADGDDSGEKAARNCAARWKREGRSVRIARAQSGMDFNDMLLGQIEDGME